MKLFDEHPRCASAGRTSCATWWTNTRTPTAPSTACSSCSPGCARLHRGGRRRPGHLRLARRRHREPAQLPVDFPNLRVIKLEQNYRSTTRILNAANTVIANNEKLFEKKLWSEHGAGEPVTVVACQTPEHEAESVVMKLSAHKFEHRTHFKDYAILYRATTRRGCSSSSCATTRSPTRSRAGAASSRTPRSGTCVPTCA